MDEIYNLLMHNFVPGRSVFDSLQEGVVIANSNRSFIFFNKAAKNILGYDGSDKLNTNDWASQFGLYHHKTEELLKCHEIPMTRALSGEDFKGYHLLMKNVLYPRGLILSVDGSPIRSGAATVGGITIFRDVTESFRLEENLKSQKDLYSTILDIMPGFVFMKDLEGRFVYANKRFKELLRIESMQGKSTSDFISKENAAEIRQHDELVLAEGRPMTFIENHCRGTILKTVRFPYRNAYGEVKGVCAVASDVTLELKESEVKLKEKDKLSHISKLAALGVLSAEIAHELKTPLSILKGNCMMLREKMEKGPDILRSHLRSTEETIDFMDKIINSLNGYSQDASLNSPQEFDFNELMDDVSTLCSLHALKNKLEFITEDSSSDGVRIYANKIQIAEVLMNLVVNALDAIEHVSHPQLKIKSSVENEELKISVFDNGPGVPSDIKDYIFEPFFTTKGLRGSGLGLSISKKIVHYNHGDLFYQETSKGHCFVMKLPIHREGPSLRSH